LQAFIESLKKETIMSLTKTTSIDQITVTENGIVLYREATRIMEDGNELSKTYHRTSLTPAQDLTGVPANVVAICNTAWTPEVIAAYQAQVAASQASMGA
jgi:DNA-binding transcriptional LysR family regulator